MGSAANASSWPGGYISINAGLLLTAESESELAAVVAHLGERPDASCYGALIEALTGIWNAAVRSAVVARLRAAGLPPDDLLLRLQSLSPTLGLQSESREWARQWMADPTAQDAQLVQQCLVRLLLALRGLAEARAQALTEPEAPSRGAR